MNHNQCPECLKELPAGAILCVHCGLNLQTGERLQTKVKRKKPTPPEHEGGLPFRLACLKFASSTSDFYGTTAHGTYAHFSMGVKQPDEGIRSLTIVCPGCQKDLNVEVAGPWIVWRRRYFILLVVAALPVSVAFVAMLEALGADPGPFAFMFGVPLLLAAIVGLFFLFRPYVAHAIKIQLPINADVFEKHRVLPPT